MSVLMRIVSIEHLDYSLLSSMSIADHAPYAYSPNLLLIEKKYHFVLSETKHWEKELLADPKVIDTQHAALAFMDIPLIFILH